MTLAWNLLFYIEDYMAIKWGNTVCTAIKWGSTVCSQVKWGNTVVFPDASGATVYGYGSNIMNCGIGHSWNNTGYSATSTYYISDPSNFKLTSSNVSVTNISIIGFNAAINSTDTWYRSTTKIKIVCSLQLRNTKSTYGGTPIIRVGTINGAGQTSNYVLNYTIGTYMPSSIGTNILLMTYTGGTYTFTSTWGTNRWYFDINCGGTYVEWTGTISEVTLLS